MLDEGTYQENPESSTYTITWTHNIESSNADEDVETTSISLDKTITVVYKDISTKEDDKLIVNTVKGKINLNDYGVEKETESLYTTKAVFEKVIKVTKTWKDSNNKYGRPSKVKVQVKQQGKEEIITTCILSEENNWTHLFTGLKKYDENGNEIQYTVDEVEADGESLRYYRKEIN